MINQINAPDLTMRLQDKVTKKLSRREQRVYNFLKDGKKTVIEISIELYLSDPRGYIRTIRSKGISIFDEWVVTKDTRFKRFWIED